MSGPDALRRLAISLGRVKERAAGDPLSHIRWLPPQRALHTCTAKRKLLRAGNQAYGKTTAGLAELIWRCLGAHPHQPVARPPIEAWVICSSWSQSLAIQGKLWDIAPRRYLSPRSRFDPVNGFGAHSPTLVFSNGSVIRVKTTNQKVLDLSGATIDVALFDEVPTSARIYGEVCKRVMARNGVVIVTMTPINAPTDWLREEAEKEMIADLHFKLTPENLIPVGSSEPHRLRDGTVCDEAWIADIRARTLGHEDAIVNDGEWETRVEGKVFRAFKDAGIKSHVRSGYPVGVDLKIVMGIDHGAGAGREVAILCAVDDRWQDPRIYVLDEYISPDETTPDQDIAAILGMLKRHGLTWSSLDHVFGDNPYSKGGISKGNLDLEDSLARALGLRNRDALSPRIHSAKRGEKTNPRESVSRAVRWLHMRMCEDVQFNVAPTCLRLIESLNKWDGPANSPHKDAIDALRYALIPWWRGGRKSWRQPTIRVA